MVVGLPDDEFAQVTHAVVDIPQERIQGCDADALLAFLRTRVVPYKLPRSM